MGTGGRTTETGDAGADDNVIRFPRDWFGSTDDLVPFGPAADRLEAAAAAARAAAAADTGVDEDLSSALNANDFWGGGSGALHQPVDALPDDAPYVTAPVGESPVDDEPPLMHLIVDDEPQLAQEPTLAEPDRLSLGAGPRLGLPRPVKLVRARVSVRVAVGVAAALVLAVIAVIGMAQGGSAPHRSASTSATLAAAKRTPATTPDAPQLSSANVALADRAHVRAATTPKTHTKPKVARKRRAKTTHRAPSKASTTAHSTPVVSSNATADDVSAATSSGDSSSSVSSGTAPVSSTSGGSTSGSSGPGGLGGAVGSNCNPTCSAQ